MQEYMQMWGQIPIIKIWGYKKIGESLDVLAICHPIFLGKETGAYYPEFSVMGHLSSHQMIQIQVPAQTFTDCQNSQTFNPIFRKVAITTSSHCV